jgi:hypothetical protein
LQQKSSQAFSGTPRGYGSDYVQELPFIMIARSEYYTDEESETLLRAK